MVLLSASNCASSEDEAGWPSLPPMGASSPVAEAGAKPLLLPDGGRGGGDSLMPPPAMSLSSWRGTLAETAAAAAASNEVEDGEEDEEEEDRCAAAAAAISKISQSRSETNLEKGKKEKKVWLGLWLFVRAGELSVQGRNLRLLQIGSSTLKVQPTKKGVGLIYRLCHGKRREKEKSYP